MSPYLTLAIAISSVSILSQWLDFFCRFSALCKACPFLANFDPVVYRQQIFYARGSGAAWCIKKALDGSVMVKVATNLD
jgi:hypothetical protein